MLQLLIVSALLAPIPVQDEGRPAPDTARVEAAVMALRVASKAKDPAELVIAIQGQSDVLDAEVVGWIAKGLNHKDESVQNASLYALRFMDHPAAVKALHKLVKRDRKLHKSPERYENVLRAIGQHGDVASIPILLDKFFNVQDHKVIKARIYSLGNIRSKESVKALFQVMKSGDRKRVQNYMKEIRISLMTLTGVDQGTSQDLWIKWWNNNKRTLEVAPRAPLLPEAVKRRWDSFWGNRRTYDRSKKRRERGSDPETGGDGS
ncbi:MAG: hypothetical protein E2O39_15740 [Planctomycetota bacterium]|nr:MAG: hypothetical protein E2O39_15740 [Planctomycetota bacterium]